MSTPVQVAPTPTQVQLAVATLAVSTDIPPSDKDAQFVDDGEDQSIWTNYEIVNYYESDKHRYMMGQTSPGTFNGATVGFVQLASPTLLWIADWTACRFNDVPVIPNPFTVDEDWILLDESPQLKNVGLANDGVTPLYRISGTYIYGHRRPSEVVVEDVNFPRNPWTADVFPRFVSDDKLTDNLINGRGV